MCDKHMIGNAGADGHSGCGCEVVQSFLELTDRMVRDIRNLRAETAKMLFVISEYADPFGVHDVREVWGFSPELSSPHYEGDAYGLYKDLYYGGGDPLAFKSYLDYISRLSRGIEDDIYKSF